MTASPGEIVLEGIPASRGLGYGRALKLDWRQRIVLKLYVPPERIEEELARFQGALLSARSQLARLKERLAERVGKEHSLILDVHALMLEDRSLISEIERIIRRDGTNAEWAVQRASERLQQIYRSLDDRFFRERGGEIESVLERILDCLPGSASAGSESAWPDIVIVAADFGPAGFASLDLARIRGLALEGSGQSSHTAILSRSLRLPAVVGVKGLLDRVASGDLVVVDGEQGAVVVGPQAGRLEDVKSNIERFRAAREAFAAAGPPGALVLDGTRIALMANIDVLGELPAARRNGAEGIGLFRSEYLFLGSARGLPGVSEQTEAYGALARQMAPYSVSIRTLDAAVDSRAASRGSGHPPSTGMGLRGIRRSLLEPDVFTCQLEAVCRAAAQGSVEILLPMVSSVQEVREARAVVDRIVSGLKGEIAPPPVGVMIEVPAAVLALEDIAAEADFLCIGTNDLIQYVLAVDRADPSVSHLYQPLHPAILTCLRRIEEVCAGTGKPVRICGEMSSNPLYAALLVGMGYHSLSMNAYSIPAVRRLLQEFRLEDLRAISREVSVSRSAQESAEILEKSVSGRTRMDLSPYLAEVGSAPRERIRGREPAHAGDANSGLRRR